MLLQKASTKNYEEDSLLKLSTHEYRLKPERSGVGSSFGDLLDYWGIAFQQYSELEMDHYILFNENRSPVDEFKMVS